MNRIFKAFKAIGWIIRNPFLLNKILNEQVVWEKYVFRKYRAINGFPTIFPDDLSGNSFGEKLELFSFLEGGSLPTDLALLKLLARKFERCKYFEIGTWRGESVVNVSDVADICYTLNLSDEEMKIRGLPKEYIDQHGFFSNSKENIIHLKGDSMKFDFQSPGLKFDLIFIDGDHHYDAVRNDTEEVFKHLVHENSIVVWHDYKNISGDIRFEVLAGILDGLPGELHTYIYYIAHTRSVVFIRQKIPSSEFTKWTFPKAYFNVALEYNRINDEKEK